MRIDRNGRIMLGVLVAVLAVIAYRVWPRTSDSAVPASNGRAATARAGRTPAPVAAPDVHLNALDEQLPGPIDAERDLFRFKPKAPPPARATGRPPAAALVPAGPPPPAPLPPIALKFIGIVQQGADSPKIALLTDGRHVPFYGREGDIIEGRYKIVHIGTESIDLAYLDGRGRQTIRLTGS